MRAKSLRTFINHQTDVMMTQNLVARRLKASFLLLNILFFQPADSQVFYGPNGLNGLFKWDLATNMLTNHVSIPTMSGDLLTRSTGKNYGLDSTGGTNGSGYIFYLTPAGIPTPIFHFPVGKRPRGSLFEGNDTKLYGIIANGIFRYDPETEEFNMVFETLTEGILGTKLMQASDGKFYGTEMLNNPNRLYRITATGGTVGTYQLLHNFVPDLQFIYGYDEETDEDYLDTVIDHRGTQPVDQVLVEVFPGKFYGTTRFSGGPEHGWPVGTIWSFDINDSLYTIEHRFWGSFGLNSFALTLAKDGRLYTMSEDIQYGTLYWINPFDPSEGSDSVNLIDTDLGRNPVNGVLTEGSDGRLYGIVRLGNWDGIEGSVFAFNIETKEFETFQYFDGVNGANASGKMVEAESVALPLRLLSFSGKLLYKNIQLRWKTAEEEGFHRFTIERSSNGNSFNEIGTVPGGKSDYEFTDVNPSAVNFYRLKMIDIDQHFRYSKIIQVNLNEAASRVLVFPNPVGSQLQVQLLGYNELLTIEILDMAGRRMKQQQVMAIGTVTATINVHELQPGNYSIVVRGAKESKITSFYKR